MNISLPGELKSFIDARVRSGFYGNASDVIRAGLRALTREEMSASYRDFQDIMKSLPTDPITPEIERGIVQAVRKLRRAKHSKPGR
jgi:putative addiction module CopG family antidote